MAGWKYWKTTDAASEDRWDNGEGRGFGMVDGRRRTFYRNRKGRNESEGRYAYDEAEDESDKQKIVVKIPAQKVGRLIGRQGNKIRELQRTTRTYISVGREDCEGEVDVSVTGSLDAVERCKRMILKLMEEYPTTESTLKHGELFRRDSEEDTFCHVDWDAVNKIAEEYEKKRWTNLPPMKKNFYVEAPEVARMSDKYVRELRRSLNNITVNYPFGGGAKIPNPVETFNQAFGPFPEVLKMLNQQNFTKPFPIQSQAWPILLTGSDMIGIAQTGTGKTLAFLLPAFIHIDGQDIPLHERSGPNVLILAPTRELALQIDGEAKKFQYRNLKSVCLYGGGEREEQIRELEKGVQIVIATPGRLNDLLASSSLCLESVTFLVLDEADRMLDMGFERQIRRILLTVRPDRQTIMTSATWPYLIQKLAEKYMKEPIKVVIGSTDLAAVHSVRQHVYIVKEEEKLDYLLDVISTLSPHDKIIIFVGKRALADSLSCDLILKKIECQSIHGSRDQCDREQAIEDLKTGAVRILVATDVASRGIDIVDVTKVINYDFPRNVEEYVHRVGRTGRAGKTGEAISFFTTYDRGHAKELISILEEANQVVPEELRALWEEHERVQERIRSVKSGRGGRHLSFRRKRRND